MKLLVAGLTLVIAVHAAMLVRHFAQMQHVPWCAWLLLFPLAVFAGIAYMCVWGKP